jgi:ABC-2 type transport system permease protein
MFKMTVLQFKMLLRDKALIIGSLGLAVVSMLIFGTLFGSDTPQPLSIGVVDLDKSATSAKMIAALKQNDAIKLVDGEQTAQVDELKKGNRAAVVILEPGFETGLANADAKVQIYIDDSNLINSARTRGLIYGIFDGFNKQATAFKPIISVQEQAVTARQLRSIDFLTPGMLGMTIMFANMFVGVALINWRERGTLKRLSATPLKAWQLMGAQIISQFVLSLAQAALILGIGAAVFNVQVKLEWLPLIFLFVIVGTFSLMSLGYVIANFVQKREAAQNIVMLVSLPMMFLAGSYFPVNPDGFLKILVDVLPLTHLNRALREIMLNESSFSSLAVNLGVLVAFGVVLMAFSVRTFRWVK